MFIDVTRYCKHVFSKKTMYMVNSHYDFINTSLQKKTPYLMYFDFY